MKLRPRRTELCMMRLLNLIVDRRPDRATSSDPRPKALTGRFVFLAATLAATAALSTVFARPGGVPVSVHSHHPGILDPEDVDHDTLTTTTLPTELCGDVGGRTWADYYGCVRNLWALELISDEKLIAAFVIAGQEDDPAEAMSRFEQLLKRAIGEH